MPTFGDDLVLKWNADTSAFEVAQEKIDDDLDKTQDKAKKTEKSWADAYGKIGLAGAAAFGAVLKGITELALVGVDELGKVETQLLRIQALGKISPEGLNELSDFARDFALETGVAADEIVNTLEKLQTLGFGVDQSREILTAAEALKTLGGGASSLKETTTGLLGVLQNAPDAFRDAADAADFMRVIIDEGDVTQAELNSEIVALAGAAKTAGINMEQLGGIIQTVTAAEKNLTTAGAQIRNILLELLGTRVEQAAAKKGIDLTGDAINRLQQIAKLSQQLSGPARTQFLTEIFQKENVEVGSILVENLDKLASNIETVGNRAGASTKNIDAFRDSIEQTRARTEAARTELALMFGERFDEDVNLISNAFVLYVQKLREAEDVTDSFSVKLGRFAMGFAEGLLPVDLFTGISREFLEANEELAKGLENTTDKTKELGEAMEDAAGSVDMMDAHVQTYKQSLAEEAEALEKVRKRQEELGKATEKIENTIIKSVIKARIDKQKDMQEQQEKLRESQEDYNRSLRDMRIELMASKAAQDAASASDGERVRQLDILGKAVGGATDANRSRRRVTEGGGGSMTGAAAPGAAMLPELRAQLDAASAQQRAELAPLLREISTLPAEQSIRAQGDVIALLEETKAVQEKAKRATESNSNLMDTVALAVADVARTPEEMTQIINQLGDVASKIDADYAEFQAAKEQLSNQLSIFASR